MAILYRPITTEITEKYKIEEYGDHMEDNAEAMKDLPMDVVNGAAAFFLSLTEELETITPRYFLRQAKEMLETESL